MITWPEEASSKTHRIPTGCGSMRMTVVFDDNGVLIGTHTTMGKAGGCTTCQVEAISRLITMNLQYGVDMAQIIKHLRGIQCPSPVWWKGQQILSCADAMGRVLEKYLKDDLQEPTPKVIEGASREPLRESDIVKGELHHHQACPECGGGLIFQEGCRTCMGCGWSKCA